MPASQLTFVWGLSQPLGYFFLIEEGHDMAPSSLHPPLLPILVARLQVLRPALSPRWQTFTEVLPLLHHSGIQALENTHSVAEMRG